MVGSQRDPGLCLCLRKSYRRIAASDDRMHNLRKDIYDLLDRSYNQSMRDNRQSLCFGDHSYTIVTGTFLLSF